MAMGIYFIMGVLGAGLNGHGLTELAPDQFYWRGIGSSAGMGGTAV